MILFQRTKRRININTIYMLIPWIKYSNLRTKWNFKISCERVYLSRIIAHHIHETQPYSYQLVFTTGIRLFCNKLEYKYYMYIHFSFDLKWHRSNARCQGQLTTRYYEKSRSSKISNERQNVICREWLSPIIESGANRRV